ncbi:hypothetical protein [Rugosimonospora africana]|uniref:Uncharacterized protein n=1 Tax=Rugosimonospora africana TaxID=556532 RepID=A0A8J3VP17_9ACTN|nr:hypothetical protein [Rugosimonospora africana]GIH12793.1 hypothetical protein Raf01_09650 [Rugosimonospora africana]
MSYEAVGLLPTGAQIVLRVPLVLLGIAGLVLAVISRPRLGGRAAILGAMGGAAFALDAILNIIWIAMSEHIYRSESTSTVAAWLDFYNVTDVVLLAAAMTLLAVAFTGRGPGGEPRPLLGAPAGPGGYTGYPPPPPPYQPTAQPQPPAQPLSPYSPPTWPNQAAQQPPIAPPQPAAQPPAFTQPGYPPPSYAAPSQPQPTYPQQTYPQQTYPAAEAPTYHVPSAPPHSAPPAHPHSAPPAPPEPPHSAPPAHHS